MKQPILLCVALAGAVMAVTPTMATAGKTAVKFSLLPVEQRQLPTANPASDAFPAKFSVAMKPYANYTFSSLTPDICYGKLIDGGTLGVYTPKPGVCRFRIAVADTENYTGALEYTLTVPKTAQLPYYPLMTFIENVPDSRSPTPLGVGANVYAWLKPMVTEMGAGWGTKFGTPYQILTSDSNVCTATATTDNDDLMKITPVAVGPGSCTITVLRPESAMFAESRVDWQIQVYMPPKSDQHIVFPAISNPGIGNSATLSATGGDSGNAVIFSSQTPSACTIAGNVLTVLTEGTCTVAADQDGNAKFNAAPQQTQTVNIVAAPVAKTPQTIALGSTPDSMIVGTTATLSATGGDSGNAVTFSSQNVAVCAVDGNVLTAKAAGSCVVEANQQGNDQYGDAPANILKVEVKDKTPQVIGIGPLDFLQVGGTATLSAMGGGSGNPVRFSSLTPDTCTINGSTLTAVSKGNCIVAADQDGNASFAPAVQATEYLAITEAPTPFSATVEVYGDLTEQTILAQFNPAADHLDTIGCGFLGAQVGELFFFANDSGGWKQYTDASSLAAVNCGWLYKGMKSVISSADMSSLVGAQIFVGYGLGDDAAQSFAEMTKSKRLMQVYTVK